MMHKKYKIIIIAGIAIMALLLLTPRETSVKPIPDQNQISISLIAGGQTTFIATYSGTSLYEALTAARQNGQISLSGKNYPGLGFFVTQINSLQSGNGKYLFYYINSEEASVGVSSYKPKDGDVIEWKLK